MSSRTSKASEGSHTEHRQGMELVAWRLLAALLLGVTLMERVSSGASSGDEIDSVETPRSIAAWSDINGEGFLRSIVRG